jgi:WD40 repeat protein
VLKGHQDAIVAAAISADERWLVTASNDRTASLWRFTIEELIDLARVTVGRNLTREEWNLYFQEKAYRKTFPDLPDLE